MPSLHRLLAALALAGVAPAAAAQTGDNARTTPVTPNCPSCAEWNAPQAPFRIHGNTYYVGTRGLSAILVTSPNGHVLIDGGLPESAAPIIANVHALGFLVEDIRVIVNSHAHYDHAGGIADLVKASGAAVFAHPWSAQVMKRGRSIAGDPQLGLDLPYPPMATVQLLKDRGPVRHGTLSLTPHFTGGHTPGGTTWTWRSCEGTVCYDMVYADSQTPISADGFRYTASTTYPNAVQDFERGHARIESLACDILVTPHPGAVGLFAKLDARENGNPAAFRDTSACRTYAANARAALQRRLAQERAGR